jgi:ubiquinone/menaquinone biosynthesis C-methylase UbiE
MLFHSRAHDRLLEVSSIRDGMRVLEIATGSGEMFQRLAGRNPNGLTVGVDLSPNMAARTQRIARTRNSRAKTFCQAVDARQMPFRAACFDMVVCCYLLELLAAEDIVRTLHEVRRVLREGGRFGLVVIGENTDVFNHLYRIAGSVAPAFWGRQVERNIADVLESHSFSVITDCEVQQTGYPSRVLVARR